MTTALAAYRPSTRLTLAQSAWDQFFGDVLATFTHPNPDLNRDLAMDKTLRALGRRPQPPLTEQERSDLEVRSDVEQIIATASHPNGLRNHELFDGIEPVDANDDRLEALCDELDDCEVSTG